MKLILVRHAQTNFNLLKLANSDPNVDVHLSEEGVKQAESLAELLKDVNYDIVFISELPRTRQTAEIINKYHSRELIVDALLNDNSTGFESKPTQDWLDALELSKDRFAANFNNGESLNNASDRAKKFLDGLKTKGYDSVLVVTHGFLTQAIFGHIENKSLSESAEFNLVQGTYAEFEI